MPKKRSPKQYYIQWVVESAQYLYMDIHNLDHIFNWTMTYKKNSDFYLPYGRVVKIKDHPPPGPELGMISHKKPLITFLVSSIKSKI